MPVKRREAKRRLDEMDINMEGHLRCGSYLFPSGSEFVDDAHRRAMWARHRDAIMAQERPGWRPKAYWDYERAWPAEAESEEDAVHRLPDTSDAERREIEASWLHSIHVALFHGTDEADARRRAASFCGVPSWFFDQHAPRIRAELEAERQAWEEVRQGHPARAEELTCR